MISDILKAFLKKSLPSSSLRFVMGLFYGWTGNYKSWEAAKSKCTGYDAEIIFEKVRSSSMLVRNGNAVYERDSVVFEKIQYSYPVLSALMWSAARNNGRLNVLDFGGSLGTSYFQNKVFLDSLEEVHWCIVEQPEFVRIGRKDFADDTLRFFDTIEDCINSFNINVILFSSVLQYLEDPFALVNKIKKLKIEMILIDRTPMILDKDRITIQKVKPTIYKASYPCWFFNYDRFISAFTPEYKLIMEFDAIDRANIPSEFKGFIFQINR